MGSFGSWIERALLASRWLLVVFYLGLAVGLAIYAVSFVLKVAKLAAYAVGYGEADMILAMLGLIDSALVASLVVMVMISGYENFVNRVGEGGPDLAWLGKLDTGTLKVKLASAIVAISSIHLLQVFLNMSEAETGQVIWLTVLHWTFVASALILGLLDRMTGAAKAGPPQGPV